MDDQAYLHEASQTVRFWVLAGADYVAASVSAHALHYHFQPTARDDDPLQTYQAHAHDLAACVLRRLAQGSSAPIMLRENDLRAMAEK